MIEQFINFVIRPPRADYDPDQNLWEMEFILGGRTYKREDLELRNARGYTLHCSHYVPSPFPQDTPLPCVIYCHGNSGCRADANEVVAVLLPSNITIFTLDFSGSGLSDGDYVSLGWHERGDLKVAVAHLRNSRRVSSIGLWGRSMGAVTSLLYGAEDPSIAGMVLDSAFSNLFDLMLELVDLYKIRLPKFTVKMALQYMRRIILRKAKFDIMDLNCLQVASKTFIPALIGHANEDKFIQPHHSDLIFRSYMGDKNIIRFDGDHNSSRPQFYYDSVSIFFYNVLHPPHISSCLNKIETHYALGDLKVGAGVNEEPSSDGGGTFGNGEPSYLQDKPESQSEECCSYASSNRESWGKCSSLGGSDEETYAEQTTANNSDKAFAARLRSTQKYPLGYPLEQKKEKKNALVTPKKQKREKFVKFEALSQRIRLCILKRVNHRQRHSS